MKRYYSQETGCTYLDGLHQRMPPDAVFLTEELYAAVIRDAGINTVRRHDEQGLPYLVDVVPSAFDLALEARSWRDNQLTAVTWLRDRHRDQLEMMAPTTLDHEQYLALLTYMQALRDWPQSAQFPNAEHQPSAPLWLAEQAD